MPEQSSYDYAVVRVVPDLERGEFLNAGIVLFAKVPGILAARVWLDEERGVQAVEHWSDWWYPLEFLWLKVEPLHGFANPEFAEDRKSVV